MRAAGPGLGRGGGQGEDRVLRIEPTGRYPVPVERVGARVGPQRQQPPLEQDRIGGDGPAEMSATIR